MSPPTGPEEAEGDQGGGQAGVLGGSQQAAQGGGDERLDRCGSTEAVKGNPETQTLTGNALDQYGSVRSTALTTLRVGWPATMWPSFAIGESLTAGGACIRQYDKHQQSPALQIRPISL
jgi:hypothetical protein